jgi:YVTN family beta-propeller protein
MGISGGDQPPSRTVRRRLVGIGGRLAVLIVISLVFAAGILALEASIPRHAPARARAAAAAGLPLARWQKPSPMPSPPPNVYLGATATSVPVNLARFPGRVYVPDSTNNGVVDVIDPTTYAVLAHVRVGNTPYHITPSWDMSHLYVGNEASGTLTVIDPVTGTAAASIPVPHPYNLYFAPDGKTAIVVAERERRLVIMDPNTWAALGSIPIPWPGVDHLDFSADGGYLLASTEFAGVVVKVDLASRTVVGTVTVRGLPIDIRLSPDGSVFYVANQGRGGVSVIDPVAMKEVAFLPTGRGAHGFQLSRDATRLYVSNRLEGSISIIDLVSREVVGKWHTGGSPDMMQISPDGHQLWVSGRFDRAVYVLDTGTGAVIKTIHVGNQPHGLTYFPNVGRFSIGHNGVYR